MNQRFRRIVLNTPLLTTCLRNRRSSCSCDSLGRKTTRAKTLTSLPKGDQRNKQGLGCKKHTNLVTSQDKGARSTYFDAPVDIIPEFWRNGREGKQPISPFNQNSAHTAQLNKKSPLAMTYSPRGLPPKYHRRW
jgi:hypothetical protein